MLPVYPGQDHLLVKDGNPKFFYGYIIVMVSAFILIIMHGTYNTFGVFFSSLQNEFAASRAVIAGAISLEFFLEGQYANIHGRLTDRFGPRIVIIGAALILGLGYFLMSRIHSLWQLFLVLAIFIGLGNSSGNVSLLSTVTRWFIRRRSLMSSFVKVGTGLGMFTMPVAASWLISSFGWRNAYVVLSIIVMVGILALTPFLKRDPGKMGLEPLGINDDKGENARLRSSVQLSPGQVLHTRQFWVACLAYFTAWYVTQSVIVQIVSYAQDQGISTTQAAGIASIIGGVSIPGRVVLGSIGDKLSNRRALVICFVILVVSLVWLKTIGTSLWGLYVFAGIYGFAHGGFFAIISPLIAELFGTKSHGANYGMIMSIGMGGGAIGPVITGRIFDVTHSYELAFIIMIAVSAGALVLILTQLKPVRGLSPSHPD
jgi:MFS family permease